MAFYPQGDKKMERVVVLILVLFIMPSAVAEEVKTAKQLNKAGTEFYRDGNYREAIQSFKKSIHMSSDYAIAHYNLALTYTKLSKYKDAIKSFKEVIRIDPNDAQAYHNIGISYMKLGKYDDAIGALKEAIRLKPDYALAHFNLGLAYISTGNEEEALDEYDILKENSPRLAGKLFNLIR